MSGATHREPTTGFPNSGAGTAVPVVILSADHSIVRTHASSRRDLVVWWGVNGTPCQQFPGWYR